MNIYEKIFARLEELHISPIELFKDPDLETKRRLLRYFELIEIYRGINQENESKILSEMFQLFRMLTATILL